MARPDHFRVMPGFTYPINTNQMESYRPSPLNTKVHVRMASGQGYVVDDCTMAEFEDAMFGTKETTDAEYF